MKKKLVDKLGKSLKDATKYTDRLIGKNKNDDPHMSINELLQKPKQEEERQQTNYQSHFNDLKVKMQMQKTKTMQQMKNINLWKFQQKDKLMKPFEALKDKVEDKLDILEEKIEAKRDKYRQKIQKDRSNTIKESVEQNKSIPFFTKMRESTVNTLNNTKRNYQSTYKSLEKKINSEEKIKKIKDFGNRFSFKRQQSENISKPIEKVKRPTQPIAQNKPSFFTSNTVKKTIEEASKKDFNMPQISQISNLMKNFLEMKGKFDMSKLEFIPRLLNSMFWRLTFLFFLGMFAYGIGSSIPSQIRRHWKETKQSMKESVKETVKPK